MGELLSPLNEREDNLNNTNKMKNYQKSAVNILQKMNVKFKSEYLTHDYHFADDKETRDIYRVTFQRGTSRFSLRFGQSLANTGEHPTPYDVLACIEKHDVGDFENFCSEFGYDINSRKAEKIYKAVCKEYEKVSRFFSSDELEILQNIN